jgi:hypothetical protein
VAAALLAALVSPPSGHAAPPITPKVVRPQSLDVKSRVNDGLATMWVTLTGTAADSKVEFQVHRAPTTAWRMMGNWLGECLPDRTLLLRWQREHPQHPARALWAKALARKRYESLIFIRRDLLDTWPSCTQEEAMSMRQTDLHPGYPDYRKQLLAVLATLPPVPLTSSCGLLLE